jgi:putative nucleotidyltransferase with HDIG domain
VIAAPAREDRLEVVKRLVAALRATELYSRDHPIVTRNLDAFSDAVATLHQRQDAIVIAIVEDEVVVDDYPLTQVDLTGGLVRRLRDAGIERIGIARGASAGELSILVRALMNGETNSGSEPLTLPSAPHIKLGRVVVEERSARASSDMASFKQLYTDAVVAAETLWESAQTESQPDTPVAQRAIDHLAQAVSQNRATLLALTTLKSYHNYTFTHMVNVSILTMGQARALGIEGALLREFGLAALMHDIGKVRTPLEILNKPDKLTDAEFAVMKRHTIDGAEILRETPQIPALAPIVAFEHHLRLDGSGYPEGADRPSLNLATMLCSIADVYDAMRSQRQYQQAYPTDRILEVLRRNDGTQFDRHLVRRFVQLVGIYPVGNLVRLDTGEAAVVSLINAADPRRPSVRVIANRLGERLEFPYDVDLYANDDSDGRPSSVAAPLDPAAFGVDPLSYL